MKHNVLLLLISFFIGAQPAFAGETQPRMIAVTGEAVATVQPDQAILSGQLVSKAKRLADAKADNDALTTRMLAVVKKFGIPENKIAASNVYINPEYIWNQPQNKQEHVGYIVTRNLTITIDKLGQHEELLSALVDNGVDQVSGVRFALSNEDALVDELRVKAVKNARDRAELLAKAAGAKIGKVLYITTGAAATPPMPVMGHARMAVAEMKSDASVAPSLPGTIDLREQVSVTYELN